MEHGQDFHPPHTHLSCDVRVYINTSDSVCFCVGAVTSVIMGNPRMKKQTQQTKVKSGLCFLKYLGNSSDTEVTMVSMVANWEGNKGQRNVKRRQGGGGRVSEDFFLINNTIIGSINI